MFRVEHASHLVFLDDEHRGGSDCDCSRHALGQARKALFPQKSPGPCSATTASLPALLITVSFTPPSWMYITLFAESPCVKTVSLSRNTRTFLPKPTESSYDCTSNAGTLELAFGVNRRADARRTEADTMVQTSTIPSCVPY